MSDERPKASFMNTPGLSSSGVKINPRDYMPKSQSEYSDVMALIRPLAKGYQFLCQYKCSEAVKEF